MRVKHADKKPNQQQPSKLTDSVGGVLKIRTAEKYFGILEISLKQLNALKAFHPDS
ncbi:hypothetical protein CYPRO_0760 [Cyclonatronum proteinivorum]|uniref:Uncharacterized protein n=1 Tax=Cyclonatronum proteinivorum TaxID=1457365 RepID=A0A345UHU1_9BACT|nr:hypothetical protein CYPRO_0760 [Cyclonatronum proteinivorum]